MIRHSAAAWVTLVVLAAAGSYLITQEVRGLEVQVRGIDRAILVNQEAIHVLNAEWAYLNQPARLDDLGRRLLRLAPLRGERVIDLRWLTAGRAIAAVAPEAGP
jgi:hypothetical protein